MISGQSLVPAARLGALLTEQRTDRGLTVEELCIASALPFSPDEIRRIEQGQLTLTDDQVTRLMRAYGVSPGELVPDRSELVIDLNHGALFAGQRTRILPREASFDDVLERYLSLLYLMRGLEPGRRLSLRDHDLEVLAEALERNLAEIEGRLFDLMLDDESAPWFGRWRHRLAVPAAGILVGLTTVGSLVLVQFPKGARGDMAVGDGQAAADVAPAGIALAVSPDDASTRAADSGVVGVGVDVGVGEVELGPATVVEREDVDGPAVTYVPGDPESVGAAASSLINYDYMAVLDGWTVSFDGPRDGFRGNTNTVQRSITVYVSNGDSAATVADVLAHEIGHAIDVMFLDDTQRSEWLELRGIEGEWWPTSGGADFHTGAGDYAEAIAALLVGSPSDSHHGGFSDQELATAAATLPQEY